MYTYSAYLKVIGAANNEKAEKFLNSYELRSMEPKHRRAEKDALDKAKAGFIKRIKANPEIKKSDTIIITAPNLKIAQDAFAKFGIAAEINKNYLYLKNLRNYNDVFKVRAFSHAYIFLGRCPIDKIPEFIKQNEKRIFDLTRVKNYRLEIKGISHKERIRLISETIFLNDILVNSPSAYSIEILAETRDNSAQLLLNPLTDERFSYRKESVPASITGANAAAVCAFASEYFKPNAKVLDNFCGSGTMLFERGFYKHGKLMGIDINDKAIKAAKTNSKFAPVHPAFIHMDALKFNSEEFDEIIANMPFGLRVGNHNKNEKLYQSYIKMLPSILTDKGIAVLYTQEKKLLEKTLHKQPNLKLLKKETFEAGGLNPSAYILQKT